MFSLTISATITKILWVPRMSKVVVLRTHITGCSLIAPSPKCSGAHQHVVSTRSQIVSFVSEAQPCNLYPLYLGIMLDAEVTVSKHVSAVIKASFAALRRIRTVRRSVPRHALLTLIQALVVTTRRRTLGDRAFPVVAARAWNSLPSFVRDKQSLAAFRHQLKTVLFRTSFGEDINANIVRHGTTRRRSDSSLWQHVGPRHHTVALPTRQRHCRPTRYAV